MMLERWQRTGLVPPQQPPLIMKAKGSPPVPAAARTRASNRCARGVIPSHPGMSGEEVHREVVQVDPDLLEASQMLDHRHAVLAPVAGELVAAEGRVRLDHVPGVDPHRAGLQALGEAVRALEVLRLPAAATEPGALLLADLDVALDLAQLLLRDERAHPGREVHRIAHLDLLRPLHEALDEAVVEAFLDEDAGAGRADLTRVHV